MYNVFMVQVCNPDDDLTNDPFQDFPIVDVGVVVELGEGGQKFK